MSYEVQQGHKSVLDLAKHFPDSVGIRILLVAEQGDGLLDKLAVISGKRHLGDGIVRICISVVNPVVHFYRGIVAQLVRPHNLYVHLYGPGADTLGDSLHVVQGLATSVNEVVKRPSSVSVSQTVVYRLVPNQGILIRGLNLTGYYTFNYRRFSYPAAFSQSFVQRRSAGSWLVGFSYQGGSMKTTDEIPETVPKGRIYIGHFGIGGGYGYNLVVREKWLFHISALPTLVLFNRNNITINDEQRKMRTFFPDIIFNERVAVVRNFSAKYFAGATLVMSNTLFNDSDIRINQNKWLTRFFFGFRI